MDKYRPLLIMFFSALTPILLSVIAWLFQDNSSIIRTQFSSMNNNIMTLNDNMKKLNDVQHNERLENRVYQEKVTSEMQNIKHEIIDISKEVTAVKDVSKKNSARLDKYYPMKDDNYRK